jgi:Spy/CpxP family protein refolding chaperone
MGDVLNEEQMATFKKSFGQRPGGREGAARHPILRTLMMLGRAELTPQQQEKVKKILDETMKKIMNDILTPEQRKALKDLQKRGEGARPGGGGGDRPRRGGGDRPRRPRGGDPDTVKVAPTE